MAELSRWVGCGMDASDHHKLLRDVVADHVALALAQAEEVRLVLEHFGNLLVQL